MINLFEFLNRLKKIFQLIEFNIESLIWYGPTSPSELKKIKINKCIISPNLNNDAISASIQEKAEVILLFYPWFSNRIIDKLYKKIRILNDRNICIIEVPKNFFSISFGIHERIGSLLKLKLISLFHFKNFESGRIFEPHQQNYNFQHLINLVSDTFNLKYINYICPSNKIDNSIEKVLVYVEKIPTVDLIIECYRQKIDTIICSSIDFFTAMAADDYDINVCNISFNWLNIILQQLVTHDLELEIPEIQSFFVPSTLPIKIFSPK